ncbi:MAG: class I SAM-dependent methyltransferase [Deltaproteobacteria bacterium]|jgi:SAM-dependent methyltransferase|nr:class I SAM-dependent methyltransferase [Deltaproteobacteria bacterium]
MSFNPNQLLNNPAALLSVPGRRVLPPGPEAAPAEPTPLPPYDKTMYENAFSRLGMLNIANVVDLGCGPGRFAGVMTERRQRPEVYLGVDRGHDQIKTAKAAFPGWSFLYGDFCDPQIRSQYERYEAFLLLNVLEQLEDDLGFLAGVPSGKPVVFSMPQFPKEGALRYYADSSSLRERYSSLLSVRAMGRYVSSSGEVYAMAQGVRW